MEEAVSSTNRAHILQTGNLDRRWWSWLCRFLLATILLCVVIDAVFDRTYEDGGDGVAYLDIADSVAGKNFSALLNAYWSPAYPLVLSVGLQLLHPSPARQTAAVYGINLAIALFALMCLVYLVRSLPASRNAPSYFGFTMPMLLAVAYGLFILSIQGDVPMERITPDLLLGGLLWLSFGLLARLTGDQRTYRYPALAVVLSLGFYTKASALPLALVVLIILPFAGDNKAKAIRGSCIFLATIALLVGPYVVKLSYSKGRVTFGDTGALNYAWIVDGASRGHVQNNSLPGHAHMSLQHPRRMVLAAPAVFEFDSTIAGTDPVVDDPSFWEEGLTPAWYLKGQVWHIAMNSYHTLSWLARRGAFVIALLFLLVIQWRLRAPGPFYNIAPAVGCCLAVLGMYLLVDVEDRYVYSVLIASLLLLLAAVRLPHSSNVQPILQACIFLSLCGVAVRSLEVGSAKVFYAVKERSFGPYDDRYWRVAESLRDKLNIHAHDNIACMALGCENLYWARLAGVRVIAEVGDAQTRKAAAPGTESVAEFWASGPEERARAMAKLSEIGVKAVVTRGLGDGAEGWVALGQELYAKSTR